MRITVKKAISIFLIVQLCILVVYPFSSAIFANIEVAFLSAFFVILGSSFAYKRMVHSQVESGQYEDKRELLDEIEDPYELYDDEPINDAPYEELDLKEIVKEERAKIKTFNFQSMKKGVRGSVSAFRLVPYAFLIIGFIALKNNNILMLSYYLPSLLLGIVVGSLVSKKLL